MRLCATHAASLPGASPAPRVPSCDKTSPPRPRGEHPRRSKAATATFWHEATSPLGSIGRSTPSPHCSPSLNDPNNYPLPHTSLSPGLACSEDKHIETRVLTSSQGKPLPSRAGALLIVIEN